MRRLRDLAGPVRRWAIALTLAAASCGRDDADCIQPPCALPLAVELTVTAAGTGLPVAGASFTVGGAMSGQGPCPQAKCLVSGGPGTYDVDARAPGYQPAHARVIVPGETVACGCATVEAQRVTLTLPPEG